MPQKSTFIIIIYKETDLHWQWPMQVCYLETIFTAPFYSISIIPFTLLQELENDIIVCTIVHIKGIIILVILIIF